MLTKLRGGTDELGVETGRWSGNKMGEEKCKKGTLGKVEDEMHFVER